MSVAARMRAAACPSAPGSAPAPLLERCVGHEVVTAVGPVAVIKPQFEKLGIAAEVVDVDAYRKDYRERMGLKPEKEDKKKAAKK